MISSTHISFLKILLILSILLPVAVSAKPSDNEEAVDFSILEEIDLLSPYMSTSQRIRYVKLETALREAQSLLESGKYLANAKPSKLNPNRDIKADRQRGERLMQRAEETIRDRRIAMVKLLEDVEVNKSKQLTVNLEKYDYTLPTSTFDAALDIHGRRLLEASQEKGYEILFFDGVFVRHSNGTDRSDSAIRNLAYDTLVKIDGTNFSLTVPMELQLKPDSQGKDSHIFTYDNIDVFEDNQKALLALELIVPAGSKTGLLSLRTIDLNTQTIAAHELVKITDLPDVLDREDVGLEDRIPEQIRLRDPEQTLDQLERLHEAYIFSIRDKSKTGETAALLTHALVNASELPLADSDFIKRAYGETLEMPDNWMGQANAHLTLESEEADGTYSLSAQADDSSRVLSAGRLYLDQSTAEDK